MNTIIRGIWYCLMGPLALVGLAILVVFGALIASAWLVGLVFYVLLGALADDVAEEQEAEGIRTAT